MSTGDAGPGTAVQAGAGEATGGEGGEQGGVDVAQLAQSLQQMQSGQEELRQFLTSEPWRQQEAGQQEQEPAAPELDLSFLGGEEPGFDVGQLAERLGTLVQETASRQAEQLVQQHVQPLNEQLERQRIQTEAQQLVDEFPEMGDPEVGPQVVQFARQLAEHNGQPELANQPWFWRLSYMAGRAAQLAAEEGSAHTPDPAHLEGGSGARPGAQQVDMAEQIISSDGGRRGRSALPFG